MKISDIIAKRDSSQQSQMQSTVDDAERLSRQRQDIEKELAGLTQPPQPEYKIPQQPQAQFKEPVQQMMDPIPPEPEPEPEPENISKRIMFRMSVFLENGQKLPITFAEYPEEVPGMLKRLDAEIEAGRVVTIGDFKFPSSRVMYIDLQGR